MYHYLMPANVVSGLIKRSTFGLRSAKLIIRQPHPYYYRRPHENYLLDYGDPISPLCPSDVPCPVDAPVENSTFGLCIVVWGLF